MRESTPILASLVIHAGLLLAAFNMPQLLDYVKQREEQKPIYTMELVPSKKEKPIALEKSRPQKNLTKKKLAKVKPKSFYQQPKKAKNVVTQKQKSPVKVIETAGRSTSKGGIPQAQNLTDSPKAQSGVDEVLDGRFLRQQGGNRPPLYPVADRIRRESGKVMVLGYVDRNGDVSRVQIEDSTGTPRMESNAIQAFSNYKFQKGQEGWVKMPFEFTLDGEARVISVRNSRLLRSIQ